ncbi:Cystatin-related plant [Arabidopsis thaliana x Arabidopsis arenosa]|uniref:Cystatin-related plant n=1 Tax=Arabidopsis thaliana x Arabidopsis arenosa TaxID=1240361 RepID=A0A8T2AR38_9BRAS|nr:Cystatin-related plant [Arabidopsis thaliana x Arabidopsis arenosa]
MDMAPKSSDEETKDGSLIETTDPMKISNPGEREGVDDAEEDNDSDSDSDSNWDKDSFDGREYHTSDHSDYSDEDLQRRARFYNRKVIETKGFFEPSEDFPIYLWAGISTVRDLDKDVWKGVSGREFLGNMASECVAKYNKRKKKNVKFERILRANFNPGGRTKYYITFAARDQSDSPDDAPLVEYQAKVVWSAGQTYPILCRPTSPPKLVEGDGGDHLKEVAKVMEESS